MLEDMTIQASQTLLNMFWVILTVIVIAAIATAKMPTSK